MDIFLVNYDHEHAKGLCEKLSNAKDGAITPLDDGEMELYVSKDFQHVHFGADKSQMFTKLEPGARYVAVVDFAKVEISDITAMSERLGVQIGIVRVRT